MLNMANERYQNNPSSSFINEYGMDYLLPRLKQEYPFLKKSEARILQVFKNKHHKFKRINKN